MGAGQQISAKEDPGLSRDLLLREIFPRIASIQSQVAFLTVFGFTYTQLGKYDKALLDSLFSKFVRYTFPMSDPEWWKRYLPFYHDNSASKNPWNENYKRALTGIAEKCFDDYKPLQKYKRYAKKIAFNLRCPLPFFVFMRAYRTFLDESSLSNMSKQFDEFPYMIGKNISYNPEILRATLNSFKLSFYYERSDESLELRLPFSGNHENCIRCRPRLPILENDDCPYPKLSSADLTPFDIENEYSILDAIVYSESDALLQVDLIDMHFSGNGKRALDRIYEKFEINVPFYTQLIKTLGLISGNHQFRLEYEEFVNKSKIAAALSNANTKKIKRESWLDSK